MTSQYSTNLLSTLLPNTQASSNSAQNPNLQNASDKGFSSALDNSLKNYSDKNTKTEKKENYKNPNYAQKTKSTESARKNEPAKQDIETKTTNANKTASSERSEKIKENKTQNTTENTPNTENTKNVQKKENANNTAVSESQNTKTNTASLEPDKKIENVPTENLNEETQETAEIEESVLNNVILTSVNESIIAQVEYPQQENIEAVCEENQEIPDSKITETKSKQTDVSLLKNTVLNNNIEQNMQTVLPAAENEIQTEQIAQTLAQSENLSSIGNVKTDNLAQKTGENISVLKTDNTIESNILNTTDIQDSDLNVDVQNLNTQENQNKNVLSSPQNNQTETKLQDAKTALAADNTKIVLNLEEQPETNIAADETPVVNEKPITPVDTEVDKAPVIKVTEEAASTIKEQTTSFIENKDFSSSAKDKAVSQMTSVENTDTVVTKTQTNTQENSQGESSLQQNAGEQVAKMNVENTVTPMQSNEAFASKFTSALNSSAAAQSGNASQNIDSKDIMNQINAKLDNLQNSGNSKVSIVLKPENLGRVSLEIINSQDGIIAKMTTDTQQVKELFDKNVEALKANLSSQGVNVNNIKVECSQESANHGMDFEREQFNQNMSNNQEQHNRETKNSGYSENYTSLNNQEEEQETEFGQTKEFKNTDTMIKHNGKVDYEV